jgi:hypothetical protein
LSSGIARYDFSVDRGLILQLHPADVAAFTGGQLLARWPVMRVEPCAHSAGVDFFKSGEALSAIEIAVLPRDVGSHIERAGRGAFVDQINFSELCFEMAKNNLDVGFAGSARRGGFGASINEPINQGAYNDRIDDKEAEEDFLGAWGQVEITGRRIF